MALDERLTRELARVARPADPSGVYEELIRRKERRRIARRIQAGGVALVVIVGSIGGLVTLTRIFGETDDEPIVPLTPNTNANGSIAYTDGSSIVVSAPDGSERRTIPFPVTGTPWHVAWSPDGTKLAFAVFGESERSLWVMNADGTEAVEIEVADNVHRPSWHPDGRHVTFSIERDGRAEIHVAAADGSDDSVVYVEDAPGTYAVFSSTFSPDGSQILFDAGTDAGFDIFLMDANGSNVHRLTSTGTDYNPSWSPDGSTIVFTRQEAASESDIFLMDSDGSNVERLTDDGPNATNLDAQFSPDGTMITYEAAKNGGVGPIVAIRIDGSDPRVLVPIDVLGFSWQPVPESTTTSPPPPSTGIGRDIGLGFPVCNVSSIEGAFALPDENATAFVATRVGDMGGCPQADEGFNVVAVDVDRDGLADTSYGPIECTFECRTFSTPDIDGDGTDELLVVQTGGSVVGLRLYDVATTGGTSAIRPVTVAEPGDPEGGFEPGEQPTLWLGGDAFDLYALQCGDVPAPDGPGIVATSAESLPNDSPDAEWHAHQTTLVLRDDGLLHVVDVRTFTEPVTDDPSGPSFLSGEDLCGSNLGP